MSEFFTKEVSQSYDEKNMRLAPVADAMHFLIRLILKDLPLQSRVLCVGVGTGAEIFSLAQSYPGYRFVGLDPSAPMLERCRERLQRAGLLDRCELVHGYVRDLPVGEKYDAALSVLVAHFVGRSERAQFFSEIAKHLKTGASFINTEISFDLASSDFPAMLKNWEQMQSHAGATAQSLANLPQQLRETLSVLPPHETEALLRQNGFENPLRFFQAFMISGWQATKC